MRLKQVYVYKFRKEIDIVISPVNAIATLLEIKKNSNKKMRQAVLIHHNTVHVVLTVCNSR